MSGIAYRWQIRRARAAARRARTAGDRERAMARVSTTLPGLDRDRAERIAQMSLENSAFRRIATGALLRLGAVAFCREARFDRTWTALAAAAEPPVIFLPNVGEPAVARRALALHLPNRSAPSVAELPIAVDAGIQFDLPPLPAASPIFLLAALLEPEPVAVLTVETVSRATDLSDTVERLLERAAAHYDWLNDRR